ncbi:hypothetical protein Mapa_013554 [Marchantia paleacea]|nr:hypothetical protein Mapa_013554 [Marchantia paleacea]
MSWNPAKLASENGGSSEESVLESGRKPEGTVRGLDLSVLAPIFFSSGGDDEDIYIWDRNVPTNTSDTPILNNASPRGEISNLSRSRKLYPICGSISSRRTSVLWDLRKAMPALRLAVAVCLLCLLAAGSVSSEQPSLDFGEELGTDMCPDCKPLKKVHLGPVPVISKTTCLHDEELGADMCPEKLDPYLFPRELTTHSVDLENYGVDMCPERGQPMGSPVEISVDDTDGRSTNLVKELQHLVNVQQSQIDQLADFLQALRSSRSLESLYKDPENIDLAREHTGVQADSRVQDSPTKVSEQLTLERPLTTITDGELTGAELDETFGRSAATKKKVVTAESFGSGSGGMTVARYKPAWAEHFSFLSAVKVDGEVSCLHVLPQEGEDGISRYVIVGDMTGRLYVFMWLGDLLLDHMTLSLAPITTMLSYVVLKNETILVTGHADGSVLVHRIWEAVDQGQDDTTILTIEYVHSLIPPPQRTLRTRLDSAKPGQPTNFPAPGSVKGESAADVINDQSVTNLKMYKVGKMRYTLVSDQSGKIQLFRDNGTLYGTADSPSLPLEFMRTPSAQRLVFLTDSGVGSLDLRTMQVRSSPCEGLNTSTVMAYAFDVAGRSKANGFTADGDLVYVALTGDMLHSECQVKKRRKVEVPGPFFPQALKGYLLAAAPDHVLVYNTTLHMGFNYANFWVGGPRPLFSVSLSEIAQSFLKTPIAKSRWPVMASNRDKLVVVGFGHGYVAMFRSNLPVAKPTDFSSKFWSSPILLAALVLLGLWQFFTRRREPGTIITTEYPFGGPAYRKVETVRLSFGERGEERTVVSEPRRFRSPTRGYVAPNPSTFNSGALSFRSSTVDSGSYSARREPLFASNQPVGELRETELLQ